MIETFELCRHSMVFSGIDKISCSMLVRTKYFCIQIHNLIDDELMSFAQILEFI